MVLMKLAKWRRAISYTLRTIHPAILEGKFIPVGIIRSTVNLLGTIAKLNNGTKKFVL